MYCKNIQKYRQKTSGNVTKKKEKMKKTKQVIFSDVTSPHIIYIEFTQYIYYIYYNRTIKGIIHIKINLIYQIIGTVCGLITDYSTVSFESKIITMDGTRLL